MSEEQTSPESTETSTESEDAGAKELESLKTKIKEFRSNNISLQKKLAEFEDVDVEAYREWQSTREEEERKAAEKRGEYETLVAKIREKHDGEKKKLESRIADLETWVHRTLPRSEAAEHLVREEGDPVLLLDPIRQRTRIVEERDDTGNLRFTLEYLDEKGNPMLGEEGEPATMEDLVRDLKRHRSFGKAFRSNYGHGGGASNSGPGGGPTTNPFEKGSENLTEQMRIVRENPALAAELKKRAGRK